MRISRRFLNGDERPVFTTGQHPIRLVGPLLGLLVGVGIAIAVGYYVTPKTGSDPVDLGAAAVALYFLARFLRRFLGWRRQRVVLTDERLLRLSGGMIRRVGSVSLDQISQVELVQGLFGRLLGFGTVEVQAGDQRVSYTAVKDPRELWALVSEASSSREPYGGSRRRSRGLAPGMPFDQQDTGPLPRVLV
jgi:uncharacterized membrane protein YdbT with pleckstrin-like domain